MAKEICHCLMNLQNDWPTCKGNFIEFQAIFSLSIFEVIYFFFPNNSSYLNNHTNLFLTFVPLYWFSKSNDNFIVSISSVYLITSQTNILYLKNLYLISLISIIILLQHTESNFELFAKIWHTELSLLLSINDYK